MNPLQVPQKGPYGERGPLTGRFAYLSKTSSFGFPSKVPFITFRDPNKGAPPPGFPNRAPIERERCPVSRAPFQLSLSVPSEHTCPSLEPSSPYPSGSPERSPPNRATA